MLFRTMGAFLVIALLLPAGSAVAAKPTTNLQTVWAPMAEPATPDLRVRIRVMAGFQDAVLQAEERFSGLGLLPGIGFPLGFDVRVHLTSQPWGIFERIQFTTGMLVQHDNLIPVTFGLRMLTRPVRGGITFGIEPHFITGFDLNTISVKACASRRWERFFVTLGGQAGVFLAPARSLPVVALVGGMGAEVISDLFAMTVEGGTNFTDRHRIMANLVVTIGAVQIQGGGGAAFVGGRADPTFQAVVAVPFGRMDEAKVVD